eukprot:3464225-Rhodomonas_salina.2
MARAKQDQGYFQQEVGCFERDLGYLRRDCRGFACLEAGEDGEGLGELELEELALETHVTHFGLQIALRLVPAVSYTHLTLPTICSV